jgi:ribose-phosphate pyrophosphokinase
MLSQHVDHIYTMDLHSDQIEGFFEIPVDNLSFKNIIYESLGNRKEATSESLVIVAPDMGSAHRVHRLAKLLKLPMVVADKRRNKPNSVSDMTLVGDVVDKTAIIIDDLIDTGNTLIKAGNLLKNEGAKKIVVFATHGVFSGPAFKNLLSKDTPFNEIHIANTKPIIVDSVYFDSEKSKKIINIECSFYVHNISHIFYEAIKNNYSCKSVSTSII